MVVYGLVNWSPHAPCRCVFLCLLSQQVGNTRCVGSSNTWTLTGTCIDGHFTARSGSISVQGAYTAADASQAGALSRLNLEYTFINPSSTISMVKCNGGGSDVCAGNEYSGLSWVRGFECASSCVEPVSD